MNGGTRTRGRGCWTLEDYAKEKGANLMGVWKHYDDDLDEEGQTKENWIMAEELLKMI